jgi:B12-binding domain/radical SAM domain protein
MKKRRVFCRILPCSRLAFPLLLNAWEKDGLDSEFDIMVLEPAADLKKIGGGDVVLYSLMTPDIPLVQAEIHRLKKAGARVVGGGPHITGDQELSAKIGFDVLFAGAAEHTFATFGHDLLAGRVEPIYRDNGETGQDDFNACLPISRHIPTRPPLEITRGCSWKCAYCETNRFPVQYRDPDSIRAYLEIQAREKCTRVNFISPSALEYGALKAGDIHLDRIEEILALARDFGFRFIEYGIFPSEIRPDTLSAPALEMLKRYVANKSITIGAQSGADGRLKELGRGHTSADIEQAVDLANGSGFLVNLDFIIGYPDETAEEREITYRFILRMKKAYRIKAHLHYFFPLAGSRYAFRFPAFLSPGERETWLALMKNGTAFGGWESNEKQVIGYFQWLERKFPTYYARYS